MPAAIIAAAQRYQACDATGERGESWAFRGYGNDAGVGGEEAVPCLLNAGCEWGHCAETGDYYSSHGISEVGGRL